MKGPKQPKQQLISQLLYGQDSHNLSAEDSFDEVNEYEENLIQQMHSYDGNEDKWGSNQNFLFPKVSGAEVEFSQNFSQSSMMYSHRQDDDSRQQKLDNSNKKYLKLLDEKKRQEVQFNQALQKQLNATKQQLQRGKLEISKWQNISKGLQTKVENKEMNIQKLENQLNQKQEEVAKMREEIKEVLEEMAKKNELFYQYKMQSTKILTQLSEKQSENAVLQNQNKELKAEIQNLYKALSVYNESDRKLLNFRGGYSHQGYDSPQNSTRNSLTDKQIQKLKKQKANLEIELSAFKDKWQDRENRFKMVQQENKKKISLKEKRVGQLEQKLSELKEDQLRTKTQNDINLQKLNNSITSKTKEINGLTEKINQSEKRIKSLLEDGKRKDEKVKEVSLQLLEKTKLVNEKDNEIREMKTKLEFDQTMIEDKDREVERLLSEKQMLKQQVANFEKQDKNEKVQKSDRTKKQLQKIKKDAEIVRKQNETLKKEIQQLHKQKEQLAHGSKQNKKKFQQVSKKIVQIKTSHSNLQEEMQQKDDQLQIQQEALEKAMKELNELKKEVSELKKKNENIPEMKNKIILLQSRLKSQLKQNNDSYSIANLTDAIQALQQRLEQKDKEILSLKNHARTANSCSDEEIKELEMQLAEKDDQLERITQQFIKKDALIEELRRQLELKDRTLDFTHKILVKNQKDKIELEQQKKMLEEMMNGDRDNSFEGTKQQLEQFYQHKLYELEMQLESLRAESKEKEECLRFELKNQKDRIKQLNDNLLSKDRKITPETMSQQDTVIFLSKTIKKVNRSADMLRILSRNHQFRQAWTRMDKQLRK